MLTANEIKNKQFEKTAVFGYRIDDVDVFMEDVVKTVNQIEAEKAELEKALSTGTLPFDQLQSASERIGQIIDEIDEKEMRWLELSELA